jgi:hypothetical protein
MTNPHNAPQPLGFGYIDFGTMRELSRTVPVTIKSLVFITTRGTRPDSPVPGLAAGVTGWL